MASWQNSKRTKWPDDKMTASRIGKMVSQCNGKLTKKQVKKCQVDKTASRQDF